MATKKAIPIYQLKISLMGIEPTIWRRILIPSNTTILLLHACFQDAMGWYYDHSFGLLIPDTGKVDSTISYYSSKGFRCDNDSQNNYVTLRIAEHFNTIGQEMLYHYDFGDDWLHKVELEDIINTTSRKKYPILLDGENACPPDSCGGPSAYRRMLAALNNPKHPRYEDAMIFLGDDFDPEKFYPKEVEFVNYNYLTALIKELRRRKS